jgi:hypothetical protein
MAKSKSAGSQKTSRLNKGRVAQKERARVSGTRGREFDSHLAHQSIFPASMSADLDYSFIAPELYWSGGRVYFAGERTPAVRMEPGSVVLPSVVHNHPPQKEIDKLEVDGVRFRHHDIDRQRKALPPRLS